MKHELDKYFTLSEFAEALGVSIPRVTRLMAALNIETHSKAGGLLADKAHLTALRRALKDKVIRRGRKLSVKKGSKVG